MMASAYRSSRHNAGGERAREMVSVLVEAHADLNLRNRCGQSAIILAARGAYPNDGVVQLLREHDARFDSQELARASQAFSSVTWERSAIGADMKRYCELTLTSIGDLDVCRVGWASEEHVWQNGPRYSGTLKEGDSVGDDQLSWAVDGLTQVSWHGDDRRGPQPWPTKWQKGDVISLAVDMVKGELWFGHNGVWSKEFVILSQLSSPMVSRDDGDDGIRLRFVCPALTVSHSVRYSMNLGAAPFRYPAPSDGFEPVSGTPCCAIVFQGTMPDWQPSEGLQAGGWRKVCGQDDEEGGEKSSSEESDGVDEDDSGSFESDGSEF
jgi:hypothetical protein